jgi:gamma-glutamyltranspeptidase/glutathione hydrolase
MNEVFEVNSRRSPVYSRKGIVASSQPLATAAGLEILRRGGNAADAAIATAAALNVTEPTSTGLGGDCFGLYYDAKIRTVLALNGSGRAPQSLTLERIHREGLGEGMPNFHPYTITVPGACAGWCDLVERFGSLPLVDILAPAIKLAEEGFPVAPLTSYFWRRAAAGQLGRALNGRELTIDGRGPSAGEIFRNPGLGKTLRRIAEGGKKAFYEGEIAGAIAAIIKETGGCLEERDLAAHTSTWEQPIAVNYRGIRVWECPPNGQGLAALIVLNLLEGFEMAGQEPLSVARLHLLTEALRLAFADTRRYAADPAFAPAPLEFLLSKEYSTARRGLINPHRAMQEVQYGKPLASGSDTVYFCVVDGQGNACSFINSNYMGFGTGIVPRGWGFSLQNRGHNFSLDAEHPNVLAPGKRPYHTIIPAMATHEDDQSLYAAFGVMGGFMQPQGHVQVMVAMVDDGVDAQEALNRPRLCIDADSSASKVSAEEGIPFRTLAGLAEMGHTVTPVSGYGRALFGRGQIICRDRQSGVLCSGSDPRADGCAMTLI